ncbi:MAG TPA: type II CAAX endopeptidase family protein [Candidatus Saccharibacteria bacterium]|jgi:membrane protease YdiL (CAAX protease family)|nr:type II CAAX endopeptidase family protein [Candidatus Saccharibacteria bacterium]
MSQQTEINSNESVAKTLWNNPIFILVGSMGLFLLTQLLSALAVLPVSQTLKNDNYTLAAYVGTGLLTLIVILSIIRVIHPFRWSAIGLMWPSRRALVSVIPALFIYIFISASLTILATQFIPGFNAQQVQDVGFDKLNHPAELVTAFLALVVITPIVEEVIFRGILFKGLRRRLPFWVSAVFTSVLFAVAHGQWNVAVDTFALSIILCYLVEKNQSSVPTILVHGLKNGLAFVLLFVYK